MMSNPSFPVVLGPNDLLDVLTELLEVGAAWYKIGLALKFSPGTLDAMKGPHKEPMDCMMDMLKEWLSTSPDPSWEGLIAALRHPVVAKQALARQLEAKYCTQAPPQGKLCGRSIHPNIHNACNNESEWW